MSEDASPELQPLLEAILVEIGRLPPELASMKAAMQDLFLYLCSTKGRTHGNCVAANMFFLLPERWPAGSPAGWDHLPEDYVLILDDVAGCLHDTLEAPDIARNFESTPEQLLQRTRLLPA